MSGLKTTDIYFLEAGKSKIKMWAGLVSFEASLFGLQTAALPTDCLPSLLVDVLIFSYCVYAKLLSHVRLFVQKWIGYFQEEHLHHVPRTFTSQRSE